MQVIRTSGPQGTPVIPPVKNLRDFHGHLIGLDAEAIINRHRGWSTMSDYVSRGKIVSIGDPGLPGREIIRFRPHGSSYLEACNPKDVELHVFDDYQWLTAETQAAHDVGDDRVDAWGKTFPEGRGKDLGLCVFGGFYFEMYQRAVMRRYLELQRKLVA